MADGLNEVRLLGNLGQDPELRATQSGSVLRMSLATSESFLDKNRVRQERTEWHRVTVFGKRAEALARFLSKGSKIHVSGKLRTSSYEKEGQKHYSTEIVAMNVILCGGGGARSGSSSSPGSENAGYDEADWSGGGYDDEIPF